MLFSKSTLLSRHESCRPFAQSASTASPIVAVSAVAQRQRPTSDSERIPEYSHPAKDACDIASTSALSFPAQGEPLASWGASRVVQHLENSWACGEEDNLCLELDRFHIDDKPQRARNKERTATYFANMGDAIRSLREDIPLLFEKDLNYEIYRDDILFKDPNNTFQGIKNYKTIWSSLRFSGKIVFKKLYVEVKRIWQPPSEDGVIKVRWTVHGIPRVIWQEEGLFDGISTYKLDDNGRVYEHTVDNVLLRDPPMFATPPIGVGLNLDSILGRTPQQAPIPGIYGCAATLQEAPQPSGAQSIAAAPTAANTASWLAPLAEIAALWAQRRTQQTHASQLADDRQEARSRRQQQQQLALDS